MRVWSLKTCCSITRQSRSSHSYTDVSAVLMTSALRLTPLSSGSPCPRQPISGITPGFCLWGDPPPRAPAVGTCSGDDHPGERAGVASFPPIVLRRRRAALSTGHVGSDVGQVHVCRPRAVPFGQAHPLRLDTL